MKKRKKLAAGAAMAVGTVFAPEAVHAATGSVITVNTTADTNPETPPPPAKNLESLALVVDGNCSLREAIINANDDAATWSDCAAGSGLDTIQFALPDPSTILVDGIPFEITDSLIIDGPGVDSLIIDGQDSTRIFTINDFDSGTLIDVTIEGVTLTNGFSDSDDGGAIYSEENLTLTAVTITNSDADFSGGAVRLIGAGLSPSLTVADSLLTGNTATCCGGAIAVDYASTVSITNTEISGLNTATYGGGVAIASTQTVTIDEANISGNLAIGPGGGLYLYGISGSVTIEDSVISGNDAAISGGVHIAQGEGTVTIRDTTISENTAVLYTGGLYLYDVGTVTIERVRVVDNSSGAYQGGVALWDVGATIEESQITGNSSAQNGGLYAGYGTYLYLRNSTVAYNEATTGSVGGIAIVDSFAVIEVSTISHNSAVAGAAGNVFAYQSYLYVDNSIIANGVAIAGPDLVTADSFVEINYSIIEDPTGATFTGNDNKTGEDPQLGPLQDNGGPTETMKPAPTSPAVNAGRPEFTEPTNDQRGFPRPIGIVDMGAVEINTGTLAISAPNEVGEGVGTVTVTVTRTGGADGAASVDYTTTSGTATSGADFVLASGTLNWADNEDDPKTFDVTINEDLIFEGTEGFTVDLTNPVAATLGTNSASINILDNDSAPTISIGDDTETEGTSLVFNVTLSNPTTQEVTVDFATAGVTATAGADFTANSGTVTFAALDTAEQITVVTAADGIDEPAETLNVVLTNPSPSATILDGTGEGTITDGDPTPTISINSAGVTEGGALAFEVTLSGPSSQTITVDFATAGGTAVSGTDFTANSGTVTFAAGDTSEMVSVTTLQDALDEPDESLTVELTNASAGATILDGTGEGTIIDDDLPPTISINDNGTTEGGNVVFDVTLSAPSGQTVAVNFATTGGTATSGDDFTPNSGTVTFAPGDVSEPITVVTNVDGTDEPNETFNVGLTNLINATIADGTGEGTIIDDDGPPALSIADVPLPEGNAGTTNFVFTVTLAPSSGQTVTVDYTTQDVSANAGSDYATTSGTLTFNPGDTSETITVPVSGDADVEADETFNVILSNAPLATISDALAVGTITNDDVLPSLQIDDVALAEGDGGTTNFVFTVTLSPSSTQTVTVDYTTQDGTAVAGSDYTTTAGTLTFVPGDTSETITVPVLADDAIEGNETFTVMLSGASLAAITDGSGQGTINNDDVAAVADLSVTKAVVGSGPFVAGQNATFTIVLSNAGPDSAPNATVTDVLPTGTTLVSATPTSGTCNGTTTVTCNVGTLANGGSATITLTVQLNAPGTITNTATGASDAGDISPALGSAAITVSAAATDGADIPTLSQWMLIALASALAAAAALRVKP